MTTIETTTLSELIIESHILTKQSICTHQDDTMGCYNRIIRTHTILNSRKFEIPDNIWKLHLKVHEKMNFRNQINNNTSKITYDSTKNLTIHGTWQGTRNEGTHWCFMSVPMMEIVDQVAPGCTIELPKGNAKWNIKMMGFVDDKRYYTNTLTIN